MEYLIFAGALVNGFSQTNVYPYLSAMVMTLGMTDDRNATGYFAGLLASMLMLGKMLSSPFWGVQTDRVGRRSIIILSLVAVAVCSTLFGIATNFYWALFIRFVLGLLSPIAIVLKSSAGELPSSGQTQGMLMLGMGYNTGCVLGAALGGILAQPPFLHAYPFLLPNLLCTILAVGTLIGTLWGYEETLKEPIKSEDDFPFAAYLTLLKNRRLTMAFAVSCLNNFIQTSMNELYPLWCWADESHGGLNLNPMQIGATLSFAVVIMLLIQQWLFTKLADMKGISWVCRFSTCCNVPVLFLMPTVVVLGPWNSLGLLASLLAWNLFNAQTLTSINILCNNAVSMSERGKMNGLMQTLNAGCKAFAPTIVGSIFAFSLSVEVFPIDFHLAFYFLGAMKMLQFCLSTYIDKSYEVSKDHKLARTLL